VARLLLSDDSPTVQRLIAMAFAGHNVEVSAVGDGESAIARIAQHPPDIVLASIGTPKRSGYDVAAFVKSTPALASTPVVLLAAAFEPVDEVRVAQVRCDGVMVKPLDPQQLVARVQDLLRQAPARPARAMPAVPEAPMPAPPERTGSVDDYFDRLDAAFTKRAATRAEAPADDVGTVPTVDAVLQPPVPPAAVPIPPAAPIPIVTDALIDEVTRRVVERLGTAALRDVVSDIVTDVAERLIREEIARIRHRT
jgi:DNA-binding response OmpR family regulator